MMNSAMGDRQILPWQINSIFIILIISFHKPSSPDITGFWTLFSYYVLIPESTQFFINLRIFTGKWSSRMSYHILQGLNIHTSICHIRAERMTDFSIIAAPCFKLIYRSQNTATFHEYLCIGTDKSGLLSGSLLFAGAILYYLYVSRTLSNFFP